MNRKHVLFRPEPPKPVVPARVYDFAEDGSITADGVLVGHTSCVCEHGSGIERAIFAQWRAWLGR